MKAATELIVSLSTVFGTIALALGLASCRFAYRRHKRARAAPVDPVYEETQVTLGAAGQGGADLDSGKEDKERWFGGAWGVTPVAKPGPGGTAEYLGGWFGLDAPSNAGWSAHPDPSPLTGDPAAIIPVMRESHFSRASRATRRAAKVADKLRALKGKTTKEKKKPRVSKTSEFAEFERRAGDAQELSEAEGDEDEKLGNAKEQQRHKGAEDEAKERLVR
ncbi:hypothetical protein Rhopal_003846-T1 [Rhodotorula paludigena]|uniref:Uncharacterized protein n=1 Tax=Rhodotorula paludigena TaxID=86838 RepID=A0AAV5GP91_9BASI|nr:hypothetical protein Rhopal_003846-T1 [Rhodotorula paludigena]